MPTSRASEGAGRVYAREEEEGGDEDEDDVPVSLLLREMGRLRSGRAGEQEQGQDAMEL